MSPVNAQTNQLIATLKEYKTKITKLNKPDVVSTIDQTIEELGKRPSSFNSFRKKQCTYKTRKGKKCDSHARSNGGKLFRV